MVGKDTHVGQCDFNIGPSFKNETTVKLGYNELAHYRTLFQA
jgi:hypothetical protein